MQDMLTREAAMSDKFTKALRELRVTLRRRPTAPEVLAHMKAQQSISVTESPVTA